MTPQDVPDDRPAVARVFASRDGVGSSSVLDTNAVIPGDVTSAVLRTWKTELVLVVRLPVSRAAVTDLLSAEVGRMDAAASRFREDSEISRLNRQPGRWVTVSDYLGQVLVAALTAAELTDGLVNPCLGGAVDAAGYRSWRDGEDAAVPAVPAVRPDLVNMWREVEVRQEGAAAQVRIPVGAQVDVGAVAKGWLADRLALLAAQRFGTDVLANMGGDLRAITGEDPWLVTADPEVPGVQPQSLRIWDSGLATSGTGRRRWTTGDGRAAHHIIDPRSGLPADTRWVTCSVLAADAAQANAASTAGIVLGEQGPAWVAERGLDAWFVAEGGREVRVGRWPDPGVATR